jgi:hypothetical protein
MSTTMRAATTAATGTATRLDLHDVPARADQVPLDDELGVAAPVADVDPAAHGRVPLFGGPDGALGAGG